MSIKKVRARYFYWGVCPGLRSVRPPTFALSRSTPFALRPSPFGLTPGGVLEFREGVRGGKGGWGGGVFSFIRTHEVKNFLIYLSTLIHFSVDFFMYFRLNYRKTHRSVEMEFEFFEELLQDNQHSSYELDEKLTFYERGGKLCSCGTVIKCEYSRRFKPEYSKCKECKSADKLYRKTTKMSLKRDHMLARKDAAKKERELKRSLSKQRLRLLAALTRRIRELSGERKERYRIILDKARQGRLNKLNSNPFKLCEHCQEEKRLSEFPIKRRTGRPVGRVCLQCKELKRIARHEEWERARQAKEEEKLKRKMLRPVAMTPSQLRSRKRELKRKYRRDPMHRVNRSFSESIRSQLRAIRSGKPRGGWKGLVNYTLLDLKQHLEQQFVEGMSWDNYGKWHVDHIRPKSSYNFTSTSDPQFLECWSLDNLRPLWAEDNIRKGAKWNP